ncbi:MAG: TonB-dependent receptor plug domain-containing protein, partial [Treponema sp.]|nr:TonB-dependent receptor plug domain-containing protein [Treponema sp.]
FTLGLRLAGILENRELVFETSRPGVNETRTGRSVALSEKNIEKVAELGIIEDLMTAVKLLPGVGYANMFNAQPSIRGGHPGDLVAVLDGFYIEQPYFWGGAFSIFDPRMVKSAQLSHGVFSARYGHTISGLLEVASQKPSSTETELELGISTSVTNLALSSPLFGKGGIMLMGKVTYYDPVVWAAKRLSDQIEELDVINVISTTPYIRTGALTADYRINQDLSLDFTGFFGTDGAGAFYENAGEQQGYTSRSDLKFDWLSHQLFLIGALTWNPRPEMALKASTGWGYRQEDALGDMVYSVNVPFSDSFKDKYRDLFSGTPPILRYPFYSFDTKAKIESTVTTVNLQGRIDYDWDLGNGFLFALGAQELYSRWLRDTYFSSRAEEEAESYLGKIAALGGSPPGITADSITADYVNYPAVYSIAAENSGYASSAYTLMEYSSPNSRFGAELGLRLDHFYFIGKDFSLNSKPVLNPRLNLDFGVLKNRGLIESLSLTAGTGLFSSTSDVISLLEGAGGNMELRPNRSVSTVAGAKIEFPEGLSFNIEGYYKHVFDRTYTTSSYTPDNITTMNQEYHFDGQGRIWGFDFMLQKLESRYWDGWISYSFNHAMYREPWHSGNDGTGPASGSWYYPNFHRFHVINLLLNIKPLRRFNISTRLSFVSGVPLAVIDGIPESYSVQILENGIPTSQIIEKWKRPSHRDNDNRTTWSLPLDVKFSLYRFDRKGKVISEIYVAVENVLALVYKARGNGTFNSYTGKEDRGNDTASYEIPIPIPSFGFKWSY